MHQKISSYFVRYILYSYPTTKIYLKSLQNSEIQAFECYTSSKILTLGFKSCRYKIKPLSVILDYLKIVIKQGQAPVTKSSLFRRQYINSFFRMPYLIKTDIENNSFQQIFMMPCFKNQVAILGYINPGIVGTFIVLNNFERMVIDSLHRNQLTTA